SWSEMFPPPPDWTEKDMTSQAGRVFLVTGGSTGIGYETAKTLYHLNGTVFITSRSSSSAESAITSINTSSPHPSQNVPSGQGKIDFVVMNFSDLNTIRQSAQVFLSKVNRLDGIIHNAGVMLPDNPDETTAQDWHQQLGINALAPFLLQLFLTPLILHTASLPGTPPNSVRVIFLSSSGHRAAPLPDGVAWSDINLTHSTKTGLRKAAEQYGQSKAMNCLFAYEFARKYRNKGSGIVSLSLHPGALKTGLQKNAPGWLNLLFGTLRKEARFGALTVLWASIRELEIGEEDMLGVKNGKNGAYVEPFGRWGAGDKDIFQGLVERGTGERLWGICEELVKDF
ncbi:NAD(P)-binding protein, partial [Stipitochalara longipes BDJ]